MNGFLSDEERPSVCKRVLGVIRNRATQVV